MKLRAALKRPLSNKDRMEWWYKDEKLVEDHINLVLPRVLEQLIVTDDLIFHLTVMRVVDGYINSDIRAATTEIQKAELLMSHIKKAVRSRFNPLLEALRRTHQPGVADILALPKNAVTEFRMDDAGLNRCTGMMADAYRKLGKNFSAIKGLPGINAVELGKIVPTIKMMNFDSRNQPRTDSRTTELIDAFNGSEKNTLFIGEPGCGKSGLILYLAMLWAELRAPAGGMLAGRPIPQFLRDIKLLVYLRSIDYADSLETTVRNSLQRFCGDSSSSALSFYKEMKNVAIFIDSLDEIKNWKKSQLRKDVYDLMKKNEVRVIAGVRDNHPVIDRIYGEGHIKFIQVDGFDEKGIYEFISTFFSKK